MEVDMLRVNGNITMKSVAQDSGYEPVKNAERSREVKQKEVTPVRVNSEVASPHEEFAEIYNDSSYEVDEKRATEMMDRAISAANKKLALVNTELEYRFHAKTKQVMIKVMDMESKEVIREIPPEKTLDVIAKMWELAGIMIDKRG